MCRIREIASFIFLLAFLLLLSAPLSQANVGPPQKVKKAKPTPFGRTAQPPGKGIPTQPNPDRGGNPRSGDGERSSDGTPIRRSGPTGAFSRPYWNDPALITEWEEWWLRNQHEFLEFPSEQDDLKIPGTVPAFTNQTSRIDPAELRSRCLEAFRPYLDHKATMLRQSALLSLGILNDGGSLSKIVEAIEDTNHSVRLSAVISLGLLDDAQARRELLRIVQDTARRQRPAAGNPLQSDIRSMAMLLLALGTPEIARPLLEELSNDKSLPLDNRALSLVGVGLCGREDAVEFLGDYSKNRKTGYQLLSAAVSSMGSTGESCAQPWLFASLKSDHRAVQQSAALALGHCSTINDGRAIGRLSQSCNTTRDRTFRGFSVVSMGLIGGDRAGQALRKIYRGSPSLDRPWICLGIGLAARDTDAPWADEILLEELENSSQRSTRKAAAVALGMSGCERSVDELTRILEEEDDPYLRGYCALSLGMLRAPSALPLLRAALLEENVPQVSTQAAMALGLMNDRLSAPKLMRLLTETNNEAVKLTASRSLVYLGNLHAVDWLLDRMASKKMDDVTSVYCMELISKLVTGYKLSRFKQVAARSNYACEMPLMTYLFDFEI